MNNGLSDGSQAVIMAVSAMLIAIGSMSIPAGAPWYVGMMIAGFGAIGLTIKEILGGKAPPTQPQQPQTIVIQQPQQPAQIEQPAPKQPTAEMPTDYSGMSDFDIFHKLEKDANAVGKTLLSIDTIRDEGGKVTSVTPHYLGEVKATTTG